MQMYSNAEPHWERGLNHTGKLSGVTRRSHGMIPMEKTRGPGRRKLITASALCLIGCGSPKGTIPVPQPGRPDGVIEQAELVRDLSAFAHDSMRGREAGTAD